MNENKWNGYDLFLLEKTTSINNPYKDPYKFFQFLYEFHYQRVQELGED